MNDLRSRHVFPICSAIENQIIFYWINAQTNFTTSNATLRTRMFTYFCARRNTVGEKMKKKLSKILMQELSPRSQFLSFFPYIEYGSRTLPAVRNSIHTHCSLYTPTERWDFMPTAFFESITRSLFWPAKLPESLWRFVMFAKMVDESAFEKRPHETLPWKEIYM